MEVILGVDQLRDRPESKTLDYFRTQVSRQVGPVDGAVTHDRADRAVVGDRNGKITLFRSARKAKVVVGSGTSLKDLFPMIVVFQIRIVRLVSNVIDVLNCVP